MISRLTGFSAVSCAILLAACGCVSRSEFSRVSAERDNLAREVAGTLLDLNASMDESEQLSAQLQTAISDTNAAAKRADALQAQLTQTQTEFAAAQNDLNSTRQSLAGMQKSSSELTVRLGESQRQVAVLEARNQNAIADLNHLRTQNQLQSEQAAARLTETKSALIAAQKDQAELTLVRKNLLQSEQTRTDLRTKLATSEKNVSSLTATRDTLTADLARTREQSRIGSAEAATRLAQMQAVLTGAQKDQAELKAARLKLAQVEAASAEATAKLSQAQKRVAELETKLVTLTAQAKKFEKDKPVTDITASLDASKQ